MNSTVDWMVRELMQDGLVSSKPRSVYSANTTSAADTHANDTKALHELQKRMMMANDTSIAANKLTFNSDRHGNYEVGFPDIDKVVQSMKAHQAKLEKETAMAAEARKQEEAMAEVEQMSDIPGFGMF